MTRLFAIALLAAVLIWLPGCSEDDNPANPPSSGVSFSKEIVPVLNANCVGCHSSNGPGATYLVLTADSAYANMVNRTSVQAKSYRLVLPGNADSSFFYLKVAQSNPPAGKRMPANLPALAQDKIDLIRDWINQGAKNN